MSTRRTLHSTLLVCLILLIALAATPLAAETFDLHVRTYCPPTGSCGFEGQNAYEYHVRQMVQEMNLQWEAAGIAFNPIIYPMQAGDSDEYWTVPGCASDDADRLCADGTTTCGEDLDCAGIGDSLCHCTGSCFCEDLTTTCGTSVDCGGGRCKPKSVQLRLKFAKEVASAHPEAITMMVTDGPHGCCSNPPSPEDPSWSLHTIYCDANRTVYDGGSVWAHEMGHYWCLRHPFTALDLANTFPAEPDHDGDDTSGVYDTPPDPGDRERADDWGQPRCTDGEPCTSGGFCPIGTGPCEPNIVPQYREFCEPLVFTEQISDGSPHDSYCWPDCLRCNFEVCDRPGNINPLHPIPYYPDMENAMSYHDHRCRGPYVIGGDRVEPFSEDQLFQIDLCLVAWPERQSLQEACQFPDYDSDLDGVCNSDDNCPSAAPGCPSSSNTLQLDTDEDGYGDACDLCPDDPLPTGDLDGDCIGDACDNDRDGDTCKNDKDHHPDRREVVTGKIIREGCGVNIEHLYTNEGVDSDYDGVANCYDLDDDNDGLCDEGGPYAPDEDQGIPEGCWTNDLGYDICPTDPLNLCVITGSPINCPPPWMVCVGSSCIEFFVKVTHVINPDPTTDVFYEHFEIYDRTIHLYAQGGMTAAESAILIRGRGVEIPAAGPSQNESSVRMEIWSREPEELVAVVVDEYDYSHLQFGEIDRGAFVAVTPTEDGEGNPVLIVGARFAIGQDADELLKDTDSDGRPDNVDNCLLVANFEQGDADDDGYGTACDADLNNDWMVTMDDVLEFEYCLGADLTLSASTAASDYHPDEVFGEPLAELPDMDEYWKADHCRPADMNGNLVIDLTDVAMAQAMVGLPPGPTVNHNLRPVADAGPDQNAPCYSPELFLDGSGSYDPDHDPLSCSWDVPGCTVISPDSCFTPVLCPYGIHTATLTVDDQTAQDWDEAVLFFPDCNSPGRVEESLRIEKLDDGTESLLYVTWSASCLTGATAYSLREGALGEWYSDVPITCSDPDLDFGEYIVPPPGNRYFLVVPHNWEMEGSYGKRSDGTERPFGGGDTDNVCAPVQELDDCAP